MGRGGAPKDRKDGPERKCIATGEVRPKYGMIRFVIGPDAQVVPDPLHFHFLFTMFPYDSEKTGCPQKFLVAYGGF